MVPRQGVHRHRQRREQLAHAGVLGPIAVLREVARDDDGVGGGVEIGERGHDPFDTASRIGVADPGADVQVADLREEDAVVGRQRTGAYRPRPRP